MLNYGSPCIDGEIAACEPSLGSARLSRFHRVSVQQDGFYGPAAVDDQTLRVALCEHLVADAELQLRQAMGHRVDEIAHVQHHAVGRAVAGVVQPDDAPAGANRILKPNFS